MCVTFNLVLLYLLVFIGDAYDKHAMSLPKPVLSLNYEQDEIRVPIGLALTSQGHPAQRNLCYFFVIPRTRTSNAMK